MSNRGQAYTLEAITASLLLVGGLVFALQATAVTPLSASTSSQHIENQQKAVAEGALAVAVEQDALRVAVLNWNVTGERFYDASKNESYYVDEAPDNVFGNLLTRSFGHRGIVFNVYVIYEGTNDERRRQLMVYRGQPSDNAVSASATVTLYDDDRYLDDGQTAVTVTDETHTYEESTQTNALKDAPAVPGTVHDVRDGEDTYVRGVDYAVVDSDGDGKGDTIDWSVGGAHPTDGEQFWVDYTPAISKSNGFYAPDAAPDSGVYNVVEVEVVAWRQ